MAQMHERENSFDAELGFRLKRLRQSRRVSQEDLGCMLGVSFQQIQKYETGQNRMSPERIERCARIFEVPVGYFFGSEAQTLGSFDKRVVTLAAAIAELPSDELRKRMYGLVWSMAESLRKATDVLPAHSIEV